MTFKPGNTYGNGRPKGAVNNRTREFQEILAARGFNLGEALCDIYFEAIEYFEYSKTDPIAGPPALRLVLDAAKELGAYSQPKLKSIELSKSSSLEGMSPQEKLIAMKQAVAMLEAEVLGKPVVQIGEEE